jgi:hypothetical protein
MTRLCCALWLARLAIAARRADAIAGSDVKWVLVTGAGAARAFARAPPSHAAAETEATVSTRTAAASLRTVT